MYQVSVESHFDAAHFLREYNGKCENLHGHRFGVVATLETEKLDETGLAYDFIKLKKHLNDVLSSYDHACINDVAPFDIINPSSENMAKTIYDRLAVKLQGVRLTRVEIWESPVTHVTYSP